MPTISGWSPLEPVASADINAFLLRGNRNAIINGDMRVNQRGATSVADDAFSLDRWNILSDGATITVAQSTVAPSDGKYSLAMQSGTNAKKFGVAQYIENLNCTGMWGQTVTLSFKAKVSNATNLPNIKAGILSWSSTADTLTSDFVSAWGASGTTPTLISNWTFENTPSNLGVTTSWVTYRVQGVIDTVNAANVAVFIWSDSTANTTADVLYVTDVQCEIGTIATPFERRSIGEEIARCQRYFEKSYNLETAPGTATDTGFILAMTGGQQGSTAGINDCFVFFRTTKRTSPTVTVYDNAGNANKCRRTAVGVANYDNQDVRDVNAYTNGVYFRSSTGSAATNTVSCHFTSNAEL